ncbi:hypothetical protein EYD10_11164 [Varanus komodoensis]|nr:hypothetical protein EYD10_11164 [Varanus komodoensis]
MREMGAQPHRTEHQMQESQQPSLALQPSLNFRPALLLLHRLASPPVFPAEACKTGECKELEQCDKCIEGEASRNITDCVWMRCQESPEKPGTGSCVRKGEPAKEKCLFFNVTKMCEAPQTPTPTTEHSPTTTKAPPKPQTKEPEIHTPGSTATPPLTGTPEYRPPGFDSASFIGGIVLVLSLQAVIFFVVKFLRSKDNTYQTL